MIKRLISMLFIIIALFTLIMFQGCGGGDGGGSSNGIVSSPLPQPEVDCGGEACIK